MAENYDRKDPNKRPGGLLTFSINSKGALKKCWAIIDFAKHSAKYKSHKNR